ncbi:TIGR04222 domain-containing membrane protein [Herbidospora daliensis]|uniref:TIGR04222 domain-containing membrane protein n=1 Tax=Herbidospora daliensis TaxID=295585 RepID=UPI000782A4C8|nr:TIGR04222 domain-containing membrane protein [Herbidospora daliensis]
MDFFLLFVPALVVAVAVLVQAWRLRRELRRVRSRAGSVPADLGPYALAHLVGGRDRVFRTALAALVMQGRARISRDGLVTAVRGVPGGPAEPVERGLLDLIGASGGWTVPDLRLTFGRSGVHTDGVVRELHDAGLLNEATRATAERAVAILRGWCWAAALFTPLGLLSLALGWFETVLWSVLTLTVSLLTVIIGVAVAAAYAEANRREVTDAGRAAVRAAEARHPRRAAIPPPSPSTVEDVVQVAIYGMAAYVGPDQEQVRSADSGDSGGSATAQSGGGSSYTGSSCSSSSCSSSSCGGGY